MKKRILFLEGPIAFFQPNAAELEVRLAPCELGFAHRREQALQALSDPGWDAVVADWRGSDFNGLELLDWLAEKKSSAVRFLVADLADKEAMRLCVGAPHHLLTNPCSISGLQSGLQRAFALRDWLSTDAVRQVISHMDRLPSVPALYFRLMRELQSPVPSIEAIGSALEQDPALSSKLLQLVNSAVFAFQRQISSPTEAVWLLGLQMTKSLVLLAHACQFFPEIRQGFSVETFSHHALSVAHQAKALAEFEVGSKEVVDLSFTAGLLHDFGKLILAANLPDEYGRALAAARSQGQSRLETELERARFGMTHAEVGAYVLGVWGLPLGIVEAVAFHHVPSQFSRPGFSPLTAVHVGNALVRAQERAGECPGPVAVDFDYLEAIGLRERWPIWQSIIHSSAGSRDILN